MKEPVVHKTRSGATRQAEYAARMRAEGYKQRTFWLTEEESHKVDQLLNTLRHGDADE
jgi:hypothetical protein